MEEVIGLCKKKGLRVTEPLKTILRALAKRDLPVSMADLEADPEVMASCDRTTIFRTLQRLEGVGLLRRLNFSERGAKFTLKVGASHSEYLICEGCGKVEALEIACPVHQLEKDLMEKTGFMKLHHELEFYGLCPTCA